MQPIVFKQEAKIKLVFRKYYAKYYLFSVSMMEKRFVDIKDLAEYLDLSVNTLYSWKCQRKIPCHKFGRLLKFDLKEIEEWLKERRIKEIH